ncbi:MAG: putative hemolysin [Acetobacter sp.]
MPNPATLYCVKKGGKIETHYEDKKGQVNFCRLPDGSVNEEWALFRRDNPKPSNG